MNKTFLLNSDVRSARFLGAPASVRGFWVALQAYCSGLENGGVIEGAREFNSREWSAAMGSGGGVRAVKQLVEAGFCRWAGSDLIVSWYHQDSEQRYRDQRSRASLGGHAKVARERERRERIEVRDSGGGRSSVGTASATAHTNGNPREGSESFEEGGEAERGGAEAGSAEDSPPAESPRSGPWDLPRNPDDAIHLFVGLHQERFGTPYDATPADRMTMRVRWDELGPSELHERVSTYLATAQDEPPTIAGFLGWYVGRATPRGATMSPTYRSTP